MLLVDHMTLFNSIDYGNAQHSPLPPLESSVDTIFEVIDDRHPYCINLSTPHPTLEVFDARCPLYRIDSVSEWVGGHLSAKMQVKLLDLAKSLEELCLSKGPSTPPGDDAVVVVSSPDVVLAMFIAALACGHGIQSWLSLCEEHLPVTACGMRMEYNHLVDAGNGLGSCMQLLVDRELAMAGGSSAFERIRSKLLELIR